MIELRFSFVYIIAELDFDDDSKHTGFYKIGKAECPCNRLAQLQTANARGLELIYTIQCSKDKYDWDAPVDPITKMNPLIEEHVNLREKQIQDLFDDYRCTPDRRLKKNHIQIADDTRTYGGNEWYDFRVIGINKVIDTVEEKFPDYLGVLEKQLKLQLDFF